MSEGTEAAVRLLQSSREGFLGTLENAQPFVSAVSYLFESGAPHRFGKIGLLLSDLARHTQNLQRNPNVSLLVTEPGTQPVYAKKRATVQGLASAMKDPIHFTDFKLRYVEAFPSAEIFFTFRDFHFYEIEITELHWIGGFGKIETFH